MRSIAHGLTARELEVLRHLAAGETNKAIAARLVLSVQDGGPAREQHLRQARRLLAGGGHRLRTRARLGLSALGLKSPMPPVGESWVVQPMRRRPPPAIPSAAQFNRPRRKRWQLRTETQRRNARNSRAADVTRERLLAGMPVAERRLELAGISTAVLEGGEGPPIVLLHEQGAFGASGCG